MGLKYTIEGEEDVLIAEAEDVIKKSIFTAYLYNVSNEEQIFKIIDNIKNQNRDAKHVVFAYRLENTGKYTDDKEPQNTAGKPIYSMLEKENLVNVLIVVTRYFGGILLGTGPLTRAYLGVASKALNKATKCEFVKYEIKEYELDYSQEKQKVLEINKLNGKVLEIKYEQNVKIIAKMPIK
ncbi:MAG: YigZ family protein [Clostridia bacterium]|nr:YigZ family protein [Clostridia bacterium]